MAQTLIEKIAQRFAVGLPAGHVVRTGDYLSIRPAHVMTHDNTAAVIPKFASMGATRILDREQPVLALDHDIQNRSPENLDKYARIREFAAKHDIAFYPAGRGIGHQVMVEEGFVLPGTFVVGSDSHSNLYGALGALGTPVVRTDAAAIWATGRTWWQVPDIVRVTLDGQLSPGVTGKDVIIALCGVFNHDEVLNCCIEFAGPGLAGLSIEERMAISNMTTEWGALAGVFPYDDVTRAYLLGRAEYLARRGDRTPRVTPDLVSRLDAECPRADADAYYAKDLQLDLSAVRPFVSGPNTVKTVQTVAELEYRNVRIHKAYVMSCVNGRLQDFQAAAAVVRGKRVAPGVEFYIAAASDEIERQAREAGYWQTLIEAGAIELPPGCGACIGLGRGTLEAGEVGISATNRNFKGRMGSREASVYLASPAVVAASAIAGRIAGPDAEGTHAAEDALSAVKSSAQCRVNPRLAAEAPQVQILPGFPERLEGELLLVPADNLNTDGIYGKDYTYRELPPEEMARVAMENYDPNFQAVARRGDILVGGYNFGTGSSREQAATALKYCGLQMIVAGSFSQTYKRNAFNNGYICVECPELVDTLRDAFHDVRAPTIRSGWIALVDFRSSRISLLYGPGGGAKAAHTFSPLGEVAQELVIKGGFEAVIRDRIAQSAG
jgi:homoaconitate hydratase